ncbi:type III-B CRISPR-associated protein Cas10/Cmr2 [Limnoraphis robusta Tam1]|uniref:type III-B CRISPR-associated protein Cas10/Cmr2 n=1 Tax=Limnoraphis robusta TaxID=1118279 RepID=UPI002B20FB07|nr:type III-B CRISPR-associated protein Cas10/Cmr2 [Limnoraphis robusta]MEA5539339.1 type III-B CRISPR-associated protein Cas10/Cmr2 [Limnoraphis robusta Tam1]
MTDSLPDLSIGIAWCLAWGEETQPQVNLEILQQMRKAMLENQEVSEEVKLIVQQVRQLEDIKFPDTLADLKQLTEKYSTLWNSKIGLIYGGATKIKQYVFEAAKLPDVRGASALLDRINLVDLPAFFGKGKSITISQWLSKNLPDLEAALIPELIIYSTGGNILAFCPAAFVDQLCDAIEKRYTYETLTANSCAVGDCFKFLELRLGVLPDTIDENCFWLEKYRQNRNHPLLEAYYKQPDVNEDEQFKNRKSFNELVTKLAIQFNQRRSGNHTENRLSRRYPPMFETHPYLVRDESDRRSAIAKIDEIASQPLVSEALVRKKIVGQIAKDEALQDHLPTWFNKLQLGWQPTGIKIKSWVGEFEDYLKENREQKDKYYSECPDPECYQPKKAGTVRELGNVYNGFIAYIYADGNNMGGYIQKEVKTPQDYKKFSQDIFNATEKAVYYALSEHLRPHQLKNLTDPDIENKNGDWIHPFEIITIGGDDVLLIVPANQALEVAKTLGEKFEELLKASGYNSDESYTPQEVHRCHGENLPTGNNQCELSISTGVLITAEETPIYYADKLTNQLLKSAKERAKLLRKQGYYGGTIDFLTMKSVTMIASSIKEFREQGLTKDFTKPKLRLYAAPYTLHEIGGLLKTVQAFKNVDFPRSQLYQIRSLLERGKRTAILNYRYFRVRLTQGKGTIKQDFEDVWCSAKTNEGNIAPWMYEEGKRDPDKNEESYYETIWRDLVDLFAFTEKTNTDSSKPSENPTEANQ